MKSVDLNCDLGEGCPHDAELMPLVTSANIACGAHAGDDATMRSAVALARHHGVAIGAHPGFEDRERFGRVERPVTPSGAAALVIAQFRRLQAIAREAGATIRHVKLHGALYHQVSRDPELAAAVAVAVRSLDASPALFVLAGSELEKAARALGGIEVVPEVFADRSYQPDGTLTPRHRPDALIDDEESAVAQVMGMIRDGIVRATDSTEVAIVPGTVCLHGDGPHALAFARRLRSELGIAGIRLAAPGRGSGEGGR